MPPQQSMRRVLIACAVLLTSACSGSSTSPSSVGTFADISGAWNGSFASSNNSPEQVSVTLTQSGSDITGTWTGTSVDWSGNVNAKLNGASLSGQLTFSGKTINDVTCTGSAAFSGTVTTSAISITSSSGVVGSACPAPLPTGIQIDLHR